MDATSPLHIAMFPWFAMGHITPYLHLSNKLAISAHKISFFIPKNTLKKLQHLNLHPNLITFVSITVPHVNGLPHNAETTSDVPFSLFSLIATAMDQTEKHIELLLRELKPDIVFFDFQYWLPNLTKKLGIKSLQYMILSPLLQAYVGNIPRKSKGKVLTEYDLMKPPAGFPNSSIKLHLHELRFLLSARKLEFGSGVLLLDRIDTGTELADAVAFKATKNYFRVSWLNGFNHGSVIFCAYGSEALKPPIGFYSIEDALPEAFNERVKGKGIVYGSWIQQQLILEHPSVGCFITHCGAASITEGLVNKCQLVLLSRVGSDHIFNAILMSKILKVGVEVEKAEEDGLFTKESVCKAVKTVMDDENEVGKEARANHDKIRKFLLSDNLESSCIDGFCQKLYELL
ncbi:anthocyanidin 3-O-glucoside 2'''-O-xylosyltransferase [Trifolium repens]|nr:anthocyanidin 3-O-glucoside 2'''-O-xylosyltransferase [Trifolium repens]